MRSARSRGHLLVDAINVVLRLNGNAAIPGDELVLACNTLSALVFALSIIPVAGIDDDAVLVSTEISLDSCPSAGQSQGNITLWPVIIKCPVAVVAVAATSAVVLKVRISRRKAELMWSSPEVGNVALGNVCNHTCGESILVGFHN